MARRKARNGEYSDIKRTLDGERVLGKAKMDIVGYSNHGSERAALSGVLSDISEKKCRWKQLIQAFSGV